jgi:copper chaperone CopZ
MIQTNLTIDGMACSMCEAHINDVIRSTFSVKKVTSSHRKGTAQILSEEPLSEPLVREAIEKTGYRVLTFAQEPYVKKRLFG